MKAEEESPSGGRPANTGMVGEEASSVSRWGVMEEGGGWEAVHFSFLHSMKNRTS